MPTSESRSTPDEFERLFWSVGECFFVLIVARSFGQLSMVDPSFAVLLVFEEIVSKKQRTSIADVKVSLLSL